MTSIKAIGFVIAGVIVGLLFSAVSKGGMLGGIYNQNGQSWGPFGTLITQIQKGTCTLIGTDVSQVATTTVAYDCFVQGVQSGDLVLSMFASSTPVVGNAGWIISGAKASTTNNYVTFLVTNLTGGSRVPSGTSVGSSTPYLIIR